MPNSAPSLEIFGRVLGWRSTAISLWSHMWNFFFLLNVITGVGGRSCRHGGLPFWSDSIWFYNKKMSLVETWRRRMNLRWGEWISVKKMYTPCGTARVSPVPHNLVGLDSTHSLISLISLGRLLSFFRSVCGVRPLFNLGATSHHTVVDLLAIVVNFNLNLT
jgi:hypothetical protein